MTDSISPSPNLPSFFLFVNAYLRAHPIPHSKHDLDRIWLLKELFEEHQVLFKEQYLVITGYNPQTHREIDIAKLRCLEDADGWCLSPFGIVLDGQGEMRGELRAVASKYGYPQVRKDSFDLTTSPRPPWSSTQLEWKANLESAWLDHQLEFSNPPLKVASI